MDFMINKHTLVFSKEETSLAPDETFHTASSPSLGPCSWHGPAITREDPDHAFA